MRKIYARYQRLQTMLALVALIFMMAISAHLAAGVIHEWISHIIAPAPGAPELHPGRVALIVLLSFVVFSVASSLLYRNRHRVIEHGARITSDPEESARAVLITGLSELQDRHEASTACLEMLLRDQHLSLARLMVPVDALPDDPAIAPHAKTLAGAPWLQNLRAIWYHRAKIQMILVVASKESHGQIKRFEALVKLAQLSSVEFSKRPLNVVPTGEGVDFEDYNAVQSLVERALAKGRKADFKETDMCVDVTSGTKTYSISAAASTFGPHRHFIYVNNKGIASSYNAEMRWAAELQTE